MLHAISFQWLSTRLQYLQHISTGDTAVLHKAIYDYVTFDHSVAHIFLYQTISHQDLAVKNFIAKN